ncbi:MAG: HD domain-containing protein [Lachnospiraceae bacterium]|nr:HD domain-containing protein [Lachnospiraceae bacterium]
MQQTYYATFFGLSVILSLFYLYNWHKRLDVNMTILYLMIPLTNISYMVMYRVPDAKVAGEILKIVYMGGVFLPWFIAMCVASLCQVYVSKRIRVLSFLINLGFYTSILTIGRYPLFYKSMRCDVVDGRVLFTKEYGPFHSAFYALLAGYFIASLAIIGYAFVKKTQVSRKILFLLFIPEVISICSYFFSHFFLEGIEAIPVAYVFAQIVYLIISHQMALYDVSEVVVDSMVNSGETGFITMDFKERYLGSNKTARQILPDLCGLKVDQKVEGTGNLDKSILQWIRHFREDNKNDRFMYSKPDPENPEEEKVYVVTVGYFHDGKHRRGYRLFLSDDSQNQKYIRLLDQYNAELEGEVESKTKRIVEMHNRLIVSMATMVESRDSSTGGHIKRTSEGVRILIGEMKKGGFPGLEDKFCKDLIKAAPMHDLGKIAVDDAILRKPGKFTPEEFEIMKTHAPKGAEIVRNILEETDDETFRVLAENVAHYHHERWDGSGYPDGLRGEQIPLEARIMAIADVYDALVSKRVYKEKMSFAQADHIIMEGMGKHFDKSLQIYYEKARPKLEAYYRSLEV